MFQNELNGGGAYLESRRAPVHEIDGFLGFHFSNGSVDIFRDDVPSVEETHCHVFPGSRIATNLEREQEL